MYKLTRPILFHVDPERSHEALVAIAAKAQNPFTRQVVHSVYRFEDAALETRVFGIRFANPVGLAAGFDKNARAVDMLAAVGFGFLEVGTITPRAQLGNPKPRLFRDAKKQALVNRMGFNNDGAEWLSEKLRKRKTVTPLGVNLGKNKDTPNAKAAEDYVASFQALQGSMDYAAINVSSPNTPGLRELQDKGSLLAIVHALQAVNNKSVPLLIKIAPELSGSQLQDILDVAKETHIAGLIATNTIKTDEGGLSGKPLRKRSTQVIKELYSQSAGKIPIVGVGGIFSPQDAYEKITAGASLVQLYTGLVYEGPGLVKTIKKDLVQLLRADGFSHIDEAVGSKM